MRTHLKNEKVAARREIKGNMKRWKGLPRIQMDYVSLELKFILLCEALKGFQGLADVVSWGFAVRI